MHLRLCVTNSAHITLINMPENENDESQVRISRSQTYTKPASHAHGTLVLTIHLHSTVFTPSPLKVKLRDTCERNGPLFAVNYMFMCQRHDGEDVSMLDCGDLHGILPL